MTQQLPENIITLLANNTEPMVNNFNKIVSWLIKGTESEHKLPPAVAAFLGDYASVKQQADENAKALATALELIEQLNKTLAEQATQTTALKEQVANLTAKADTTDVAESKPKARKKAEPKAETKPGPAQDEVTLTAEAVGAGEVGTVGLGELASMIDSVLAPSGTASNGSPATTAPVMDSL